MHHTNGYHHIFHAKYYSNMQNPVNNNSKISHVNFTFNYNIKICLILKIYPTFFNIA